MKMAEVKQVRDHVIRHRCHLVCFFVSYREVENATRTRNKPVKEWSVYEISFLACTRALFCFHVFWAEEVQCVPDTCLHDNEVQL